MADVLRLTRNEVFSYPRISLWVTLFHCLYVITWYLQLGSRKDFLGAIRFEFLLAGGMTLIALFYLPITRPSPLQRRILKTVGFFFLSILLSLLFSYDFEISWQVFVNRVIKFSFMGFFIIVFVRGPRQLKFFLAAFLLATMKIGQEGFYGTLTGSMLWENQGIQRLHGVTGLFAHPNSFTGLALGTLPFLYYLLPMVRWPVKCLFLLHAIFAMTIIIYSGSRTGYVGFLFFLIFLFLKSPYKAKLLGGILALALVLIPFMPTQYMQRFNTIFTGKDIEGASIEKRKTIIKDSIKIFAWHPFGVGVAAFPAVRNKYFNRRQDTHNLYLEVATNLGIQGLIAFLMFMYAMMKSLSYLRRSLAGQLVTTKALLRKDSPSSYRQHMNDLNLMQATANSVFMFLLIRLMVGLFGMDLYEIYWWFAMGLTIALLNMNIWAIQRTKYFFHHQSNLKQGIHVAYAP